MFASEKVKPVVYPVVYPLEKYSEGLSALERRKTWGKVIARIRDEDVKERAKL